MMNFPAICVDNFYQDPDEIRDYALQLEYKPSADGSWPGLRSQPLHHTNIKMAATMCRKLFSVFYDLKNQPVTWEVTSYFQKIYPMQGDAQFKNTGWIHADDNTTLAGLIYLSPNAKLSSGTSIFRLKPDSFILEKNEEKHAFFKGEAVDPVAYDRAISEHNNKFEETARFGNVYNRMIAYDGVDYHQASDFDCGEEFRLTQVFFIKNILAQHTPIARMNEYE